MELQYFESLQPDVILEIFQEYSLTKGELVPKDLPIYSAPRPLGFYPNIAIANLEEEYDSIIHGRRFLPNVVFCGKCGNVKEYSEGISTTCEICDETLQYGCKVPKTKIKSMPSKYVRKTKKFEEEKTHESVDMPMYRVKSRNGLNTDDVTDYILVLAKENGVGIEMFATDDEKATQKTRSTKHSISIKDTTNITKPGKYKDIPDSDFGDPVNYRYPHDSKHVGAAVSYFNHKGMMEDGGYTEDEWSKIGKSIAKAAGKGYSYKEGKIETPTGEFSDSMVELLEFQSIPGSHEELRDELSEAIRQTDIFGGSLENDDDDKESYCSLCVYAVSDDAVIVERYCKGITYYRAIWSKSNGAITFSSVEEVELKTVIVPKSVTVDLHLMGDEEESAEELILETASVNDMPVFSVGTWNGDTYSLEDLMEIANNFTTLQGIVQPPLKLGHQSQDKVLPKGMPAAGWVTGLKLVGEQLLASFADIPMKIAKIINAGAYKRPSVEIYSNFKDSSGIAHGKTLAAVSLLGADPPAIKDLPALDALLSLYTDQVTHNEVKIYGGLDKMPEEIKEIPKEAKEIPKEIPKEAPLEAKVEPKQPDDTANRIKEFADELAKKDTALAELAQKVTMFEEKAIAAEAKAKNQAIDLFLEKHIKAGKLAPICEPEIRAILSVTEEKVLEYGEGDTKITGTIFDMMDAIFTKLPKVIEFAELSLGGENVSDDVSKARQVVKDLQSKETDNIPVDDAELAVYAEKLEKEKGISYAEALILATKETKKK